MHDGISKATRVGELNERARVLLWLGRVEWRGRGKMQRQVDTRHWQWILDRIESGSAPKLEENHDGLEK